MRQGGMGILIFMWGKAVKQQMIWMKSKSQLVILLGWNKLIHKRALGIKELLTGRIHTAKYIIWN